MRALLPRRTLMTMLGIALLANPGQSQSPTPKMEAVAETALLMKAMHKPNFQALERLFTTKPSSDQAWQFARGQALLIAECGNLLMLRPPKNGGEETWTNRCVELRVSATVLARMIARQDLDKCKTGLRRVANVCNRCHMNFRVAVRMEPFKVEE